MAENAEREPPTADVANLHLDEVTGERVSKSELKKRQKQRETERKKAEKAAAAPAKQAPKKKEGELDESQLNPNVRVCRACVSGVLTVYSNTSRFAAAESTSLERQRIPTRILTSSTPTQIYANS